VVLVQDIPRVGPRVGNRILPVGSRALPSWVPVIRPRPGFLTLVVRTYYFLPIISDCVFVAPSRTNSACLMCWRASKRAHSHFCGRSCESLAEQKVPLLLEVPRGHVTFNKGMLLHLHKSLFLTHVLCCSRGPLQGYLGSPNAVSPSEKSLRYPGKVCLFCRICGLSVCHYAV